MKSYKRAVQNSKIVEKPEQINKPTSEPKQKQRLDFIQNLIGKARARQ